MQLYKVFFRRASKLIRLHEQETKLPRLGKYFMVLKPPFDNLTPTKERNKQDLKLEQTNIVYSLAVWQRNGFNRQPMLVNAAVYNGGHAKSKTDTFY